MDDNKQDITENPFFTRGCCATPGMYNSNEIYKPSCAKLDSYNWLNDITISDKDVTVNLTAGRGTNGFYADVEISTPGTETEIEEPTPAVKTTSDETETPKPGKTTKKNQQALFDD